MRTQMLRMLALLMALLMCIGLMACDKENGGDPPEGETPAGPVEVAVQWNFGYVASSTHNTAPNSLVEGGDKYSYTDVFTVEKAGTTITFVDDNSNSGGDYRYASSSAYVVSSWRQEGDIWVLDLDGANIAGSNGSLESLVESKLENGAMTYAYTTFSDNEHLRLCFRSGQEETFTPAVYPTVYAEYTGAEGTAAEQILLSRWFEELKAEFHNEKLEGLTVNALGDSYFGGSGLPAEQIWLNLWARKYGMNMNNYGIGGSTVAYGGHEPMCVRYADMKNNSPDIVILEGGRNDYNMQAPIGDVGSDDVSTYIGAWNVLIDGVQQKYPNAMIVVISPWNFPVDKRITRESYINAMASVAAEQGVYFIDASATADTGVDMESSAFRRQYCKNADDVSHLNAEGMKLVMPNFDRLISACYTDFLSKR